MNGTMKYTRRVNLGSYEHKEFTAEISYSVDEHDDYLKSKGEIDRAADLAVEIAEVRLGLRKPSEPVKAEVMSTAGILAAVHNLPITPQVAEHVPDQYAVDEPLPDTTDPHDRALRKRMAAEDEPLPVEPESQPHPSDAISAKSADQLLAYPTSPPVETTSLPASDEPLQNEESSGAAISGGDKFDLDAELAQAEPEISNDDFRAPVEKWVTSAPLTGRQKRVVAIQRLITKYAPQLSAIPQERRHAFRAEFAELQASVA